VRVVFGRALVAIILLAFLLYGLLLGQKKPRWSARVIDVWVVQDDVPSQKQAILILDDGRSVGCSIDSEHNGTDSHCG
jgi:hypothetical protein